MPARWYRSPAQRAADVETAELAAVRVHDPDLARLCLGAALEGYAPAIGRHRREVIHMARRRMADLALTGPVGPDREDRALLLCVVGVAPERDQPGRLDTYLWRPGFGRLAAVATAASCERKCADACQGCDVGARAVHGVALPFRPRGNTRVRCIAAHTTAAALAWPVTERWLRSLVTYARLSTMRPNAPPS